MKTLKRLFLAYLHKHWHVSVCIALFLLFQYLRIDQSPDYAYVLFIFFATLAAYNLYDLSFRQQAKVVAVIKNLPLMTGIVGAFITTFFLDSAYYLYILPVLILTISYMVPLLPGRKKLRDYHWVKLFAVVLVIVYTVTIVPGLMAAVNPTTLFYHTMAGFVFVFLVALLFDIRDMNIDKLKETKSLPLFFGITGVKRMAYFFSFAGLIIDGLLANQFILDLPELIAMMTTYISLLFFYFKITDKPKNASYSLFADGLLALPYLLHVLLTW